MAGRPKANKDVKIDESCVFALCNQRGKMREMIGSQKYCMVIQNNCFEQSRHVYEEDPAGKYIDQKTWEEYGYEQVCTVPKHYCKGCAFYLPVSEYKLVPRSINARYAWIVEKRGEKK